MELSFDLIDDLILDFDSNLTAGGLIFALAITLVSHKRSALVTPCNYSSPVSIREEVPNFSS